MSLACTLVTVFPMARRCVPPGVPVTMISSSPSACSFEPEVLHYGRTGGDRDLCRLAAVADPLSVEGVRPGGHVQQQITPVLL